MNSSARCQPKTNEYQNSRKTFFFGLVVPLLFSATFISVNGLGLGSAGPEVREKQYALVIGVNKYLNSPLNELAHAVDDARAIATQLTSENGLSELDGVIVLLDEEATRINILRALVSLKSQLNNSDTLIVYWAGHSTYDSAQDELYLIPFDASFEGSVVLDGLSLSSDLVRLGYRENTGLIFLGDGCNIGAGLEARLSSRYPDLGILSASKFDQLAFEMSHLGHGLLTHYLLKAMQSPTADLDKNGYVSLEESHHFLFSQVVEASAGRQNPSVTGKKIHHLRLVKTALDSVVLPLEGKVPDDLVGRRVSQINGRSVEISRVEPDPGGIRFLGRFSDELRDGLNELRTLKKSYLFWREEGKLQAYENPYASSHAIIVAINDYRREADPAQRGPTGFQDLNFMTQHAEDLKATLQDLGFAKSNIHTLYDSHATSSKISSLLRSYWHGGQHSVADRLLLYFGGHGSTAHGKGILVTYDYDPKRPLQTSFLMKDLTRTHAENIASHHVLMAIDSCHAGLAVARTMGNEELDPERLERFRHLSTIKNDTDLPARNVLLAGTGDQKALWVNGGVFTKSLIQALRGSADANADGILQFEELALYTRNNVAAEATSNGITQSVAAYHLSALGQGKILFLGRPSSPQTIR